MEQRLLDYLAHYGVGTLFLAQALGIFGLPIPDEFLDSVRDAGSEGRAFPDSGCRRSNWWQLDWNHA